MLTKGTFLLYEESDTAKTTYTFGDDSTKWAILYPITEYPDLDDEADTEDCTTLSDAQHVYEEALPDSGGGKDFPGYVKSTKDLDELKRLEGKVLHMAVSWGGTTQADNVTVLPTGGEIVSDFNARIKVRKTGAGVGDVRPITITVYQTPDAKTYPTTA